MDKRTFCRLCEPACGLIASVIDGQLVRLRPDHEHPFTRGYACAKGLRSLDVHRDPDRLDCPLRRQAAGFTETTWDEAIAEIAARLRATVDTYGPQAVGLYLGNPVTFNYTAGIAMRSILDALGSDRLFSAGTQDCMNKFAVSELLYGAARLHPIPDFAATEHLLLLGTNPKVSKMSFVSIADPTALLASIRNRGGTVRFVNPRRVDDRIGETVQIRPDTDAYLLAAMLSRIERTVGFDCVASEHADGLDAVARYVRRWPPGRVAGVCDVPAAKIEEMADEFAAARAAAIHSSVGVNQGRQGALAYWLQQMLVLVTGNLDRPGGVFAPNGFLPIEPAGDVGAADSYVDTPVGRFRRPVGMWPAAALADLIEAPAGGLRALIVCGGNPVLSVPGELRLRAALANLDLLVSIDLYRNATGELAHFVLPALDPYERDDINPFAQGVQPRSWIQWTDAMVAPGGERRREDWIAAQLLHALGVPSDPQVTPTAVIERALARRGLAIDEVRARRIVARPADGPGRFFSDHIQTPDRKVRCMTPALEAALVRSEALFAELAGRGASDLVMINLRTPSTLNSALANVQGARRQRDAEGNPLHISLPDARRLGVSEGEQVVVSNEHGRLVARAHLDDALRIGVVAMNHGWGHQLSPGQPHAAANPGVNVNRLMPSGADSIDPFSGMSQLTGVAVRVERLTTGSAA